MRPRITHQMLKEASLACLYDYMLDADAGAPCFVIGDIKRRLNPEPSGALLQVALKALSQEGLVSITFDEADSELYTLTPKGIIKAEEIFPEHFPDAEFVSAEEHSGVLQSLRAEVERLSSELEKSNAYKAQTTEPEREADRSDIEAAKVLMSRPRFRMTSLMAVLLPLLRSLADKFAGSAVAELAKALMKALVG